MTANPTSRPTRTHRLSGDASANRFHRFAPQPLSYADPRSASTLPPFARARRFLEYVASLGEEAVGQLLEDFDGRRDSTVDADRHVQRMFVTSARQQGRDAVVRQAEHVCDELVRSGRVAVHGAEPLRRHVATAALALVLRDLLPPELFDNVYGPFAREPRAHVAPVTEQVTASVTALVTAPVAALVDDRFASVAHDFAATTPAFHDASAEMHGPLATV
jgi:hypothetical protein